MTSQATVAATRWSDDDFLNGLKGMSDEASDKCFQSLLPQLAKRDFRRVFQLLSSNDAVIPDDVPAPLKRFLEDNRALPLVHGKPVDLERVTRGQSVFMDRALPCALVLLAKSLPEGYAAPNLSVILAKTGNLKNHTYKRLLGVLQMVNNVASVGGLGPDGKGAITAPKLRLMHSGIRHAFDREAPEYRKQFGIPVNLEDMLGTIMGFSYLVIEGLRRLSVSMTEEEAEDLYYVWAVYAQLMGIHPPGEPNSSEFVPKTLAEAAEFYDAYKRRHYAPRDENPAGVSLAVANLEMLNDFMPLPLRILGLRLIPRIYMTKLMGPVIAEQVGIRPVRLLPVTRTVVGRVPHWWRRMWQWFDKLAGTDTYHLKLSSVFFGRLVKDGLGGEMKYRIPDTMQEIRELTDTDKPGERERRVGQRRRSQQKISFPERRGASERRDVALTP